MWDEVGGRQIVLLTNNRKLSEATIAAIYKQRWKIELFLKALKQNFKIQTFVGTSSDAVHIQIWTALIAILLLKFLQLRRLEPINSYLAASPQYLCASGLVGMARHTLAWPA